MRDERTAVVSRECPEIGERFAEPVSDLPFDEAVVIFDLRPVECGRDDMRGFARSKIRRRDDARRRATRALQIFRQAECLARARVRQRDVFVIENVVRVIHVAVTHEINRFHVGSLADGGRK